MVHSLRKKVFLKGAGMKEIFSDAFLAGPGHGGTCHSLSPVIGGMSIS